jgi:putative ABC transport system permease protein
MLQLKNIVKDYSAGGTTVQALRGLSLGFRESEFVAVLGPSGCGKTTLLNIIGGLDHYTSGDLVINGKSTKDYKDADWDTYRNYSIGFVFQTYNLIPHQSVLSNVELALTLSGVAKAERVARAKKVIEAVGLADQTYKKPTQLSGGQMQRVAIARALINDPDILLADEPTGALDSETSVQIMDLLKEIAGGKLVIMVTHNPELADTYATRTVRLLDGAVLSDSNPVEDGAETQASGGRVKRPSMSFRTALSLSLNNLLTKKARTILTAFAGSIGIIGIALILSLSNGLQSYIENVERDTLSSYPITIEHESVDIGGLLEAFVGDNQSAEHELDRVYASSVMAKLVNTMVSEVRTNDLSGFKQYVKANKEELDSYVTAISYSYDVPLNLYHADAETGLYQVSPSQVFDKLGMMGETQSSMSNMNPMMQNYEMWNELIPNEEFLGSQYEVVQGRMPSAYDEAILIMDENNEIPDLMLFALGLKGDAELDAIKQTLFTGAELDDADASYAYEEILALEYSILLPTDVFEKTGDTWTDRSGDALYMQTLANGAPKLKIVGIARPNPDAAAVASESSLGYTEALTRYIIDGVNASEIVKAQTDKPDTDVFTGIVFGGEPEPMFKTMDDIVAYVNSLPDGQRQETAGAIEQMKAMGMGDEQLLAMLNNSAAAASTDATYDGNLKILGVTNLDSPSRVNIYASSFDNKEAVADFITRYNDGVEDAAKISYTDYIGLLMSSVTTVINAISYVLIAFVSISLVVSSIMIGIITYISVLERTREIGVLRSIGASKRDISRVFNAETLVIGFTAGALGIVITLLLCIPANAIIAALTGIADVAVLPPAGGVALILVSMFLTFIAGLIPSRVAANKDPVVALRTE